MVNSDAEHPTDTETSPKRERHLSKSYDTPSRKRSNALDPTVLLENPHADLADSPAEERSRDAVPLDILRAPDDHEERYNPQVSFHRFSLEMAHSKSFNRFMLFIIMVNAIAIALEMEIPEDDENSRTFAILNDVFLACYTLEFAMKLYADRVRYWFSSYNLFDFGILLVAYVDIMLSLAAADYDTTFVDMMRSLRSFRALKIVNFLPGVQVIASAMASTLKQLIQDVILLLLLLMFVFGIMGFYFFGYDATSIVIIEQWGSISATFLSLFTVVTADRWSKFIEDLVIHGGNSVLMSRTYIISFLFVGHFITSNLFIAVIITNIESSSTEFKDKLAKERDIMVHDRKKAYWIRSRREVKKMMDQANIRGQSNFQRLATEYYFSLQKRDFIVMSDLKTNMLWIDTVLKELARNHKSTKRSLIQHRDIVAKLGPVCNQAVVDSRKTSISQNKRYLLTHKQAAIHALSPGTNSGGQRRSFLQR